jgi:TRAP-type transport system small permease protein
MNRHVASDVGYSHMKFYRRLMQACGVLAALLIGAIVVLVCYDVIGRNLGLKSLPWIVEITEYSLPLITLLAAPWLLFRAEHVRIDLLTNMLSPAALRTLDRSASAVGLAVRRCSESEARLSEANGCLHTRSGVVPGR